MQMNKEKAKTITLWESVIPFFISILALLLSLFVFHYPLYLALLLGWASAFVIALKSNISWRDLVQGSYQGMKNTYIVVVILLLIGGVISIWMASGTVAGLIVYSSQYVAAKYLVVSGFILTSMMSMLLGTSVGTLSTMGIVLAGMAQVYGIPTGLIGGALLSGAMVGDRTSPLSGTVHLLAATIGVKPEQSFRLVLRSIFPVIVICLVLYGAIGYWAAEKTVHASTTAETIRVFQAYFNLNWLILLPPLLVLLLALLRVPIRSNLCFGLVLGVIFTYFIQHRSFLEILRILWQGFTLKNLQANIYLESGGIWGMFTQILIILTAGALSGILEASGMMNRFISGFLTKIRSKGGLILATVTASIVTGMIFCNQALMVIIPGRMLQSKYKDLKIEKVELVRTLSDSGVVAAPLIPWNLHGILCSAAMGIHTITYDPYAFLLLLLPIITVIRGLIHLNNSRFNRQSLLRSRI